MGEGAHRTGRELPPSSALRESPPAALPGRRPGIRVCWSRVSVPRTLGPTRCRGRRGRRRRREALAWRRGRARGFRRFCCRGRRRRGRGARWRGWRGGGGAALRVKRARCGESLDDQRKLLCDRACARQQDQGLT